MLSLGVHVCSSSLGLVSRGMRAVNHAPRDADDDEEEEEEESTLVIVECR